MMLRCGGVRCRDPKMRRGMAQNCTLAHAHLKDAVRMCEALTRCFYPRGSLGGLVSLASPKKKYSSNYPEYKTKKEPTFAYDQCMPLGVPKGT